MCKHVQTNEEIGGDKRRQCCREYFQQHHSEELVARFLCMVARAVHAHQTNLHPSLLTCAHLDAPLQATLIADQQRLAAVVAQLEQERRQ